MASSLSARCQASIRVRTVSTRVPSRSKMTALGCGSVCPERILSLLPMEPTPSFLESELGSVEHGLPVGELTYMLQIRLHSVSLPKSVSLWMTNVLCTGHCIHGLVYVERSK